MKPPFEKAFGDGWSVLERVLRRKLQTHKAAVESSSPLKRELHSAFTRSLKQLQGSRFCAVSTDVFETHRSIIVRILLPEQVSPRSVKCLLESNRVTISGIPGKKQKILSLPAPVSSKRPKQLYRDGILELRMTKAVPTGAKKKTR
jgi:HSP20 family molecular chaperone IbpA